MPHDLPNGKTVYHYFRRWQRDGTWERAMTSLRREVRAHMGRDPEPSAAIIDSQSIKTSPVRGSERGFDAGKKNSRAQADVLVDTQGLLLAVKVHTARLMDRLGAPLLLQDLGGCFPRLCHLFADSGYTDSLIEWIKTTLGWDTEIVPKADPLILINGELVRSPAKGFLVQLHRWKIERTFGWFIRFRRLARDYESLPQCSEAFIQIASIQLFLRRLTPFQSFSF
ncbi:IS5 family transposase ISMac15 [Ktedonospora formicarum]|uniref:IS5 family transposase ISMac15 n=2 Tax=Ktedonospora formicarum TaxID=2778364 RepID=A0A8J3IDN7_9CHLR|nr:IS5 family transposase ISMac15 [Ktedonospora formicarum]